MTYRLNFRTRRRYFEAIRDGLKLVEYRRSSPYWDVRAGWGVRPVIEDWNGPGPFWHPVGMLGTQRREVRTDLEFLQEIRVVTEVSVHPSPRNGLPSAVLDGGDQKIRAADGAIEESETRPHGSSSVQYPLSGTRTPSPFLRGAAGARQ